MAVTIYHNPRCSKSRETLALLEMKGVAPRVVEYLKEPPTAKELDDAKKNLIGGFPLRIDSNRKIHDYLTVIGFYKLPLTYLDDFVKNIERVTAADIKRAFAARVDPDKLVTVVVGAEETAAAAAAAR